MSLIPKDMTRFTRPRSPRARMRSGGSGRSMSIYWRFTRLIVFSAISRFQFTSADGLSVQNHEHMKNHPFLRVTLPG